MSNTTNSLRKKINSAGDLQAVVRTMKAVSASSIEQYERSVSALNDYYASIQWGLGACLREEHPTHLIANQTKKIVPTAFRAIVFGSDQGLVGQFNDVVADFARKKLVTFSKTPKVWVVGDRINALLTDQGIQVAGLFNVPSSVQGITQLVTQVLIESTKELSSKASIESEFYLFYNKKTSDEIYRPTVQRLLPLDESWRKAQLEIPWPTGNRPEVMGTGTITLQTLIREYLFVSIFRACAESLASENASRLAAMQRADKNIDDLLNNLTKKAHHLRQSIIDEELFDVVSGFEALSSH